MIKARVNIETAKGTYKPGEVIREHLSDADVEFLKKHDFISVEDMLPADNDEDAPDDTDFKGFGIDSETDDEGIEYKDEAALRKLKKDELIDYAQRLDLELDESMLKSDIIDAILNHVEEQAAG